MEPFESTLLDYHAQVPGPRCRRGQRYAWSFLLALVPAALLACQLIGLDMALWAQRHAAEAVAVLRAVRPRLPSSAAIRRLLWHIDLAVMERKVAAHNQQLDEQDGAAGSLAAVHGPRRAAASGTSSNGAGGPRSAPAPAQTGLFARLEALSHAYQRERATLEAPDLTVLTIRALCHCATCATCATLPGTPAAHGENSFSVTTAEVQRAILEISGAHPAPPAGGWTAEAQMHLPRGRGGGLCLHRRPVGR